MNKWADYYIVFENFFSLLFMLITPYSINLINNI